MNEDELLINDRCKKQAYLRKHILEDGLNPNQFQKYVESLKEDGILPIFNRLLKKKIYR
jgi:hypothetical protein